VIHLRMQQDIYKEIEMVKIKYNGPKNVNRVIGEHVWNMENNHVVVVDNQDTVKTLLDQPNGEFTLVEEKPTGEVKTKKKEK